MLFRLQKSVINKKHYIQAERRDQAALGNTVEEETAEDDLADVKDLRSNKKKENKEKQIKKKAVEVMLNLFNIKTKGFMLFHHTYLSYPLSYPFFS